MFSSFSVEVCLGMLLFFTLQHPQELDLSTSLWHTPVIPEAGWKEGLEAGRTEFYNRLGYRRTLVPNTEGGREEERTCVLLIAEHNLLLVPFIYLNLINFFFSGVLLKPVLKTLGFLTLAENATQLVFSQSMLIR